jgi:hypothetical protein
MASRTNAPHPSAHVDITATTHGRTITVTGAARRSPVNPDLVAEGRRLLDAERAMDEGERWSISGSQMDLLAWSRNNLPALLDELERLEAEITALRADLEYQRELFDKITQGTYELRVADGKEIARLKALLDEGNEA